MTHHPLSQQLLCAGHCVFPGSALAEVEAFGNHICNFGEPLEVKALQVSPLEFP